MYVLLGLLHVSAVILPLHMDCICTVRLNREEYNSSTPKKAKASISLDTAVWGSLFVQAAFLGFLVGYRPAKFCLCLRNSSVAALTVDPVT